jgi:hypothetical protein
MLSNSVGKAPLLWTGFSLSGLGAAAVAIVDGSGSQITSFGGGTQYTDAGTPPGHPVGPTLLFNNAGSWATVGSANPLPVSGSFSLTNPTIGAGVPATANYVAGNKAGNLTGLLIGSQTTANSLAVALASDQVSIPVAATLGTETTKTIGVVRNADGAGNLLTSNSSTYTAKFGLDSNLLGTLGTAFSTAGKVDVKAADGDVFVRQTTASNLNAYATLQTQTDTVMVGGVNVKEINAVTPLMGNGTTGTGSLRVTVASDNTAFAVNAAATLAAETTKTIGVVRNADGAGNLLTSNSSTYTAKFGLDMNLLGTLGTAFSTAGKIDVKGADGDVFVRQTTGSNLHVVTDSGTITTVSTVTAVTSITNALPAGSNLLGKVTTDQTTHGTSDLVAADITKVAGGVVTATNVAITDAPLNIGAQAVSSENSAITTARKAQLVTDLVGKLITLPYANPENFITGTTAAIVDTTTTQVLASAGGALRNYITAVIVTNSHATVGTFVKITDGASTIMWEGYAAAVGGGFAISFPVPLRGTAATAVNAICVTTGANVIVSACGYKGI